MGTRIRFGAALVAVVAGTLAGAPPASAGTVCEAFGTATFAAADVVSTSGCPSPPANGPSEANRITIALDASGNVVFTDVNPIADGDGAGGCAVSGDTATCPGAAGYAFDLGADDDSATVAGVASRGPSTAGDGNDVVTGGALHDDVAGGPGDDSLSGGGGDDSLDGGSGADSLVGGDGDDTLTGDAGNDALAGEAGADSLDGGADGDSLDGGTADDRVDGGAGNDSASGGPGSDTVVGGDGDDQVSGGDGADRLDGDPATGSCRGSAGLDVLSGDGGDDTLCGGDGPAAGPDNDAIGGGEGFDRVFYPRLGPVTVSLDGSAGDGEAGESDNVSPDVEAVTGGSAGDTLTGNDGPNSLDGGPGSDVLNGLGGPDFLADSGGDGGADTLNGGDGDDTLGDAGPGGDTFNGGDGEDLLSAYRARTTAVSVTIDGSADDGAAGEGDNVATDVEDVVAGSGDDTLVGSDGDNDLSGGAGADTISGGNGNDGLYGGSGRDTIDGGAGRDLLAGEAGADSLRSRDGATDRDSCGGGTDSVQAEGRDDVSGDCENADIAPPAPVRIKSVVVTRAGFVVVRITCPVVEQRCGGIVIVKTVRRVAHRFIRLGQVGYTRLGGGELRVVRARIARSDRRPLRRAKRVKVRAVVTNVNPSTGASTSATKLAKVSTRGL